MNQWQTVTEFELTQGEMLVTLDLSLAINWALLDSIRSLEPYCSEFLIHAADNEGLQAGVDIELVRKLAEWCNTPVTYAGGARTVADLDLVKESSNGKVDLTIGSALDIFGGSGASFDECVQWNQRNGD